MLREEYGNADKIFDRNQAICKAKLDLDRERYMFSDYYPVFSEMMHFFRIKGITRFWKEDEILDSNTLMADALCGILTDQLGYAYIIKGSKESIELYVGINQSRAESLRGVLMSAFPAMEIEDVADFTTIIPQNVTGGGIATGIPTNKMDPDSRNPRIQIDQLIRGLLGKNFIYAVYATAINSIQVIQMHDKLLDEMSLTYEYQKETKTRNIGTSIEAQSFIHTKYFENLEALEKTFDVGINRGMWYSTTLFASYDDNPAEDTATRIANLIRATFSGEESKPDLIRTIRSVTRDQLVHMLSRFETPGDMMPDVNNHPLGDDVDFMYTTVINSDQLAVQTSMPCKEYPGYYIDDYVEFDSANRMLGKLKNPVRLGSIRQAGRGMQIDENDETYNPYYVERDDYTRHCLIIGITGGGKTNTSKSLLRSLWNQQDPRIPFLVIESAKREYWELRKITGFEDLTVFTLGCDDDRVGVKYRLNPFETLPGISLQTHIDSVLATFKAAFEMYPPMPYVLETAVYEIYKDRGWNIITSENDYGLTLYPTINDLYDKIGYVVDNMNYHQEVASNIKAALEARIHSLMIGGKGAMLNTPKSIPIGDLLSAPTVLELEDIGDDETKSFVIGILMTQLYEYRKANMGQQGGAKKLKHILMIEEAHRLLKNVSGDANSTQAKSVEFFCNMLAEIRTYGQGIFIADQVPTKLAPDTLKNTNLKIVHRTVAKEDREFVGNAMNMTPQQIRYLSSLRRGYAAVYAEGDNSPKYVKLPYVQDNPELKKLTRSEILDGVRGRVKKYYEHIDLPVHHAACTYCEMENRCKYYDRMNTLLGKETPKIAEAFKAYGYKPEKILRIFEVSRFRDIDFEPMEKICFIGIVLQACPEIHDGMRKHILADVLKYMSEQ